MDLLKIGAKLALIHTSKSLFCINTTFRDCVDRFRFCMNWNYSRIFVVIFPFPLFQLSKSEVVIPKYIVSKGLIFQPSLTFQSLIGFTSDTRLGDNNSLVSVFFHNFCICCQYFFRGTSLFWEIFWLVHYLICYLFWRVFFNRLVTSGVFMSP